MRQFLPRPAAHVAALAAAAVLVTGGAAAKPTPLVPAAPAQADVTPQSVLMINGDRLIVTSAATGSRTLGIAPTPRGRLAGPMLGLGLGSKAFEIPQLALPYLGHGLNPDLFSVSALLREAAGGRLPVTITYGGRVPSLPGVTITEAAGGTARGYLTQAGAEAFGAALARQFAADHARGSYGQDGIFAGGVSVALAGTPNQPAKPSPDFPMHAVTVTGTNLAGKPDTGDCVYVFNADSAIRDNGFQNLGCFYHGVAKLSLPAGHYWAIGDFLAQVKRKPIEYAPILPQFSVRRNTTVHVDGRAADSQLQVVTPRPAVPDDAAFELLHPTPGGSADGVWFFDINNPNGFAKFFVSPTTRRSTVGTLQAYAFEQLSSPTTAKGTPYEYNVAYADAPGLVPPQRYVVRPSSLATVHARYYSDMNTTGYESRFGVFPLQWKTDPAALFLPDILPKRVPRRQTQYLTGNPAILWADTAGQSNRGLAGGQADDLRIFRPGQQLTENWDAYPLHAGYNTRLVGAANLFPSLTPSVPSAARAGNTLTLDVMPFSDSTLGHIGASGFIGGFAGTIANITGHYEIGENGKVIAAGDPLQGNKAVGPFGEFHTQVTLSPRPATIRLVLDASRKAKIYTISTASHTVWTWRSRRDSGARLPAGWACGVTRSGTPADGRSCAVQPMMTLEYAVAGESLHGATRPGLQTVHVSVGHLQLARAIPVTGAAVSVSFDGGTTWLRARVTGHGGSYTATFTAPAGVKVSLRTSAADATGGTVTETLTNAYQISP